MALGSAVSSLLGLPALSWTMPFSGIIAVLIDIDHIGLPPHRTPLGHSAAAAPFWIYVAAASAQAMAPSLTGGALLAACCAFLSHLGMDSLTRAGIYLVPFGRRPADWLRPLPASELIGHAGRFYLAGDEGRWQAVLDGDAAFPAWRRLRTGWVVPERLRTFGRAYDAALSTAGLLGVLIAVMAGR